MKIKERYIDPFTDFGFKKLFGAEPNKDLLIDFLNQLLKDKKKIKDLRYSMNEHSGRIPEYRKAIFDLYCVSDTGDRFIIELQKVKQQHFKDRSIYYGTFPIQEQAPGGNWDYQLREVYTIGIMDFVFEDSHPDQFMHEVKLIETKTKEVFYDKLTFIYLEIPKFRKKEEELETHFDKWLFLLQNLNKFTEIPTALQERIFRKVFTIAEVSNLNEEDMNAYELSLKHKRDWKNSLDTAVDEGRKKGMKEGMKKREIELIKQMKKQNIPINIISEITGLPVKELEKL